MPVTKHNRGFTLIEMIVGIVIFAVVLGLMTTLIFPQAGRSVDPIMQVRATELANTLLREISAKRFDENGNGSIRCNDDLDNDGDLNNAGESACTASGSFGPDAGENRNAVTSNYDDVDDYHNLNQGLGQTDPVIRNSLGETILIDGVNLYSGFAVNVTVVYDGNMDGAADSDQSAKLITVTVTTPGGQDLHFSTYRSNY